MSPGNLVWNRRDATYGVLLGLPGAAVIAAGHVQSGVELVVGMLVAALVGVQPARAKRRAVLAIGALFAASVSLGALLATQPVLAIPGIAVVAMFSARLAAEKPFGIVAMNLCLPILGIGFSFDPAGAVGFSLLVLAGSAYGYVMSLAYNEYPAAAETRAHGLMSGPEARRYGWLLALTASTSALAGFVLEVDHVGWVIGAALLVIRPSPELQEVRSIGRVVAVYVGALAAAPLIVLHAPAWVFALCVPAALIGLAATHTSRWYVNAGFTTFLVIISLTYGDEGSLRHFLYERTIETVMGVGIACFFGIAAPKVIDKLNRLTRDG